MSEILVRYMKEHNLSQADLARRLGVSESLVSLYLSGKRKPGKDVAPKIHKLTGIPILEILYPDKEAHRG